MGNRYVIGDADVPAELDAEGAIKQGAGPSPLPEPDDSRAANLAGMSDDGRDPTCLFRQIIAGDEPTTQRIRA